MDDLLPRAAGDLQHDAVSGQNARENVEYRPLVALRRGNKPLPVSSLFAMLPQHQSSMQANAAFQPRRATTTRRARLVRSGVSCGCSSAATLATAPQLAFSFGPF